MKQNNMLIGFVTKKGVMLDLDYVSERKVKGLAHILCEKFKLEGYLIIQSSTKNYYHVIFNRYTTWRETLQVIFSVLLGDTILWGIHQARKGWLTLRVSEKNGYKPKIIFIKGKTDKLITEYLEFYHITSMVEEHIKAYILEPIK